MSRVGRDFEIPQTPPFIATKTLAAPATFCPNKICDKLELKIHASENKTC